MRTRTPPSEPHTTRRTHGSTDAVRPARPTSRRGHRGHHARPARPARRPAPSSPCAACSSTWSVGRRCSPPRTGARRPPSPTSSDVARRHRPDPRGPRRRHERPRCARPDDRRALRRGARRRRSPASSSSTAWCTAGTWPRPPASPTTRPTSSWPRPTPSPGGRSIRCATARPSPPPSSPPADATPIERLVAYTGRRHLTRRHTAVSTQTLHHSTTSKRSRRSSRRPGPPATTP